MLATTSPRNHLRCVRLFMVPLPQVAYQLHQGNGIHW